MKAVILAGGLGTRISEESATRPKPMIEILGKPILHHLIDSLPKEITELIIVVGYKGILVMVFMILSFAVATRDT